jgi:hypothetical protein
MGFESYKGNLKVISGLVPAGDNPILLQACNVQIDENGKTLDKFIEQATSGNGGNYTMDFNKGTLTIKVKN